MLKVFQILPANNIDEGGQVYSSNNTNPVFTIVLVPLVLLLSSCSERSEYGKKSDYEKLGAL